MKHLLFTAFLLLGVISYAQTKVIIAGIQGVDANKYTVNNSLTLVGGNASACATSPAEYKGRHVIIDQS
ncbi:MAG: hypothetical protein ACFNP4_08115, partial [Capnocytophaga gingivalis]